MLVWEEGEGPALLYLKGRTLQLGLVFYSGALDLLPLVAVVLLVSSMGACVAVLLIRRSALSALPYGSL